MKRFTPGVDKTKVGKSDFVQFWGSLQKLFQKIDKNGGNYTK